jgi:hypothetical protein
MRRLKELDERLEAVGRNSRYSLSTSTDGSYGGLGEGVVGVFDVGLRKENEKESQLRFRGKGQRKEQGEKAERRTNSSRSTTLMFPAFANAITTRNRFLLLSTGSENRTKKEGRWSTKTCGRSSAMRAHCSRATEATSGGAWRRRRRGRMRGAWREEGAI